MSKIIKVLGLLGSSGALFIGSMYITKGDIFLSVLFSVLSFTFLLAITHFLVHYKSRENSYRNKTPEWALFFLMAILFGMSYPVCLHYFDIEYSRKSEIKASAFEKLEATNQMIQSAEKMASDKVTNFTIGVQKDKQTFLLSRTKKNWDALVGHFGDQGEEKIGPRPGYSGTSSEFEQRLNKAIASREEYLKTRYDLSGVRTNFDFFNVNSRSAFDNWNLLTIGRTYYGLDKNYDEVYAEIKEVIPDFDFPKSLTSEDLYLNDWTYTFMKSDFSNKLWIFSILAILYFLTLTPYLLFNRKVPDVILKYDKKQSGYKPPGAIDI